MFTRFALTFVAAVTFAGTAIAQERDIYAALNAVTESPDGAAIAQGLIEVGNILTEMDVNQTIAFRTSLNLLAASGQVGTGTAERDMVNALWQRTTRHLLSLCSVDRSDETVVKVSVELGSPYRCRIE